MWFQGGLSLFILQCDQSTHKRKSKKKILERLLYETVMGGQRSKGININLPSSFSDRMVINRGCSTCQNVLFEHKT